MKPNFALSLSFDGITLYHRTAGGWNLVDEVALDGQDLAADMAALRETAIAIDPAGIRSKLILPNEQIKYVSIPMPVDRADIDASVVDALHGATPYDLADLSFDWSVRGNTILIAAVARETLAEAEGFASEYAFEPVSFVAIPTPTDFDGEPFFGLSEVEAATGADEDAVRDADAVKVVGKATVVPPAVGGPEPANEDRTTETPSDLEASTSDLAASSPGEAPEQEVQAGDGGSRTPEATPDVAPMAAPTEEATEQEPVADVTASSGDVSERNAPEKDKRAEDIADAGEPTKTPEQPHAFASIRTPRGEANDGKSPKLDRAKLDGAKRDGDGKDPKPVVIAPKPTSKDIAKSDVALPSAAVAAATLDATSAEASPAFSTRRSRKLRPDPAPRRVPDPKDERQRMTVFGSRDKAAVGGKPKFLGLALTAGLLLFLVMVAAWASVFGDGLASLFGGDDEPALVADVSGDDIGGEAVTIAPEITPDTAQTEQASLIPDEEVSVLDDPATEILSRVDPADLSPDEAMARYAATGIWQLAPEPPSALDAREMRDVYRTTSEPGLTFGDVASLPNGNAAVSDAMFFAPNSPVAAETRFVVDERGFVVGTPEGAITPDGVTVYSGAPVDVIPAAFPRGGVEAVAPEAEAVGAETPVAEEPAAEVPAFAGVRPKSRPEALTQQAEAREQEDSANSALAALRPKPRPDAVQNLAEAEEAKAAEEAAAKAEADAQAKAEADEKAKQQAEAEAVAAALAAAQERAAKRAAEEAEAQAQARTAAEAQAKAQAEAEAKAKAEADAQVQAAAAAAQQRQLAFAGATAQAVRRSVKPNTRPRNFERTVQRAQRNQQRQTSRNSGGNARSGDEAAPKQTVAVRASQRITPKAPTAASVAKRATQKNALKFKRVNLIGVYGTSSNRRALVRLNNGRYQKVKVGDRLDGGRVRAIGDAELRYQKGGRNILLKMPRG